MKIFLAVLAIPASLLIFGLWQNYNVPVSRMKRECSWNADTGTEYTQFKCIHGEYYVLKDDLK